MRSKSSLKLPPGVFKGATPADAKSRWFDTNLVRWVNGRLQPVGGYYALGYTTASTIRKVLTWADNFGSIHTALLCDQHLYVVRNGALRDITPSDGIKSPVATTAVAGFGDGSFGGGLYGVARDTPKTTLPPGNAFSLQTWGQDLLAMTSADGRLLRWDPTLRDGMLPAYQVDGPGNNNRCFVVTPEEYCIVFGLGGDSRHLGWCSKSDLDDWDFSSVTNTAGEYFIEPASAIRSAINIKAGTLFFTDRSAHMLTYDGVPYIYALSKVAGSCAPVSAQAITEFSNRAVWLSESGFWMFDGSGIVSLSSDLYDWIKQEADPLQWREHTAAVYLNKFPEVYWFFPPAGSSENGRYAAWNFADNWWSNGYVGRSAGEASQYNTLPLLSAGTKLYSHEAGTGYEDGAIAYARTASMNVGNGANSTLFQMLPDHDGDDTCPVFDVYSYDNRVNQRSLANADDHAGPLVSENGYVDVRLTGRDFSLKVSSPDAKTNSWSMGEALIDIRPRGSR